MNQTTVAGYEVVERIGRGGMGVVYRARDDVLGRDVALKYIDRPDLHQSSDIDRLIHEARVASSLRHPGIVTIYGFVPEGPCIAMEYVTGRTLAKRLASGAMDVDDVLGLGVELAEAMDRAHRAGVIHADFKPANIMIDNVGHAKVLDFGLARLQLTEELTTLSISAEHTDRLAGTIPYMSPEQAMGRPFDQRTDIFSFGCVLFEMLTGRRPFAGSTPAATLNALLNESPRNFETLVREAPPELSDLILRMLEKDPARRLQSIAEAAATLRQLRDGVQPSRRLRPSPSHNWMQYSVRRTLATFAAAAIVVTLGWFAGQLPESEDKARQTRVFIAQPEHYAVDSAAPLDPLIWTSVLNGLSLLKSVQPIPHQRRAPGGSTLGELARLAAADEWLDIQYDPQHPLGNVHIQRIRSSDGALLDHTRFAIPVGQVTQSARAVLSQTLALYGDLETPASATFSALTEEVYRQFTEIYSTLDRGLADRESLFVDLMQLIKENSAFPAAEILAIDLAHDLFTDTENTDYLQTATALLNRLRLYHPNRMAVVQREITLAIDRDQTAEAERLVQELTRYSPNDPIVFLALSRLAEHGGDLESAAKLATDAADAGPLTWGARYRAVKLAVRIGNVDLARFHIGEILKLTPGNTLALGQSGLVELLYGDLDRAIETYQGLLQRKRHRSYLVNLGLAWMLKGQYAQARDHFAQALEINPGHHVAMLNLADAELAVGNRARGYDLYQAILDDHSADGSASALMLEAQCLAHLGDYGAAIEGTLKALTRAPDDAEIAYQAALVHTLVGEFESARVNAGAALERGMDPRWFTLPAFAPMNRKLGARLALGD